MTQIYQILQLSQIHSRVKYGSSSLSQLAANSIRILPQMTDKTQTMRQITTPRFDRVQQILQEYEYPVA